MVELLAASGVASMGLFGYNRENFFFDREQKQKREFQEQNMRVEQFGLYREDVRDLVELTVSKMDLYLIMGALLVDKTFMMICKQGEAFPKESPEWVVAINSMSLSSAVFYLLLTLWLAMYASISAQSFGTRLLTQFVRLPIVDAQQLDSASARATDFEGKGATDMLRVPVLQRNAAGVKREATAGANSSQQAAPAPSLGPSFGGGGGGGAVNLLPTAMLDHIRLYRRVQLNWQAYDAYARVSLFCGANCVLYSCLYWCLGEFIQKSEHAQLPAIGVAIIFATIQLVLSRLDLRLRRRETIVLGIVLFAIPLITTVGMIEAKYIATMKQEWIHDNHDNPEGDKEEAFKKIDVNTESYVMNVCALFAHLLHTLVMGLILRAAWPDEVKTDEDALLPGKFRSTLYLDVFGWLANPGVKKSSRSRPMDGSSMASSAGGSRVPRTQTTGWGASDTAEAEPGSVVRRSSMELAPDIAREAHRLLTPNAAQEGRFGGAEAMSHEQMADISAPSAAASTGFHGSHAPRKVSEKVRMPGETPWRAFCLGTVVILLMWAISTVWCLVTVITHVECNDTNQFFTNFWCIRFEEEEEEELHTPLLRAVPGTLTHHLACAADGGPLALRLVHSAQAEVSVRGPDGSFTRVVDGGCGLRRQTSDVALACPNNSTLDSGHCVAALLRRGGRVVSLCQLEPRGTRKTLMLSPTGSFRLASGTPALQSVAVALGVGRGDTFGNLVKGQLADLRVFGRASDGSLLALRPFPVAPQRGHLLPEFEIETAATGARKTSRRGESSPRERIFAVGSGILSLTPFDEEDHCSSGSCFDGSLQLRAWNTSTGEYAAHRSLAASLSAMCSSPINNMAQ